MQRGRPPTWVPGRSTGRHLIHYAIEYPSSSRCQSINQPFIVLTETKFSYSYIPVWARYSPREHARERERMSKRGTEKKEERENGAGTTTAAVGASSQQRQQWGLRGRGLDRRRDTAGPASIDSMDVPARLWSAEGRSGRAPTIAGTVRRSTGQAVGEGRWDAGVHDKIFHRSRQRTDAFQGDGAIFFRVLEPSAPTTLTSWGRHPVRTPTTVASHDSRTPVSGGMFVCDGLGDFGGARLGLCGRWSWGDTFATPI